MEKVLKLTHVTPKILSQSEYERLVSLVQANADEIEKRAVEYYKKNGVCNIHIDAYVRSKTAYGSDDMADTFRFDCQPQHGYVTPSDECEPNPFAIDEKTRLRIMKYASYYVTSVFTHMFGDQLKYINKAKEYEYRARRDWRISRAVTLIGWLIAALLFVVAIIKL